MLLVERFDSTNSGQHHLISVASLINRFDITQFDEAAMSYPGISQLAKRIGGHTGSLPAVIFRRMLFNIAIGNTDDHLRNHAFYRKAGHPEYELTPAYDVVPNTGLQGSHAIALGEFGSTPSRDNLVAAQRRMGLSRSAARNIAEEVLAITDNWRDALSGAGVSATDLAVLERCFAYRNVLTDFLEA